MAKTMIQPKFYVGHRCTRWDVYPRPQTLEAVAHDWHGFWARTVGCERFYSSWFCSPASYVMIKEITQQEADQWLAVGSLVAAVCAVVSGGRSRSDERAARRYATQVAIACE